MCSVRHKEMKRVKKAYDMCSVLYLTVTVIENTTTSMKQDNKTSLKSDFVSKKSRIEIQISQQQQEQQQQQKKTSTKEKKTFNNETENEKTMKKDVKFLKNFENVERIFQQSFNYYFQK